MTRRNALSHEGVVETLGSALRETASQHNVALPEELDNDASFASLGLDSLAMVEFATLAGERLCIDLHPELAFNYPTISALADHIAGKL